MTPWMALWILFRDFFVLDILVSIVFFMMMCYAVWWKPKRRPSRRFRRLLKPIQITNPLVYKRP